MKPKKYYDDIKLRISPELKREIKLNKGKKSMSEFVRKAIENEIKKGKVWNLAIKDLSNA